jgi:RecB family exonuclease
MAHGERRKVNTGDIISNFELRNSTPSILIQSLAAIWRAHPTAEKILIVPTYQIGRQILEALANQTGGWLNLRLATPLALALDGIAPRIAEEGLTLLSDSQQDAILLQAYQRVRKTFFPERPGPGLLAALGSVMEELRMGEFPHRDMQSIRHTDAAKAAELEQILIFYNEELTRIKAVDAPAVFQMARDARARGTGLFLVSESLRRFRLVEEFLTGLAAGNLIIVRGDPVIGLPSPPQRFRKPEEKLPVSPLSFLFAPDQAPDARPSLDIFAAAGERNECRAVLSRILTSAAPFDQVEILLVDYHAYAPLLDDLRKALGNLPMTFGAGLPASRSGPARAVAGFARWIRDGFPEALLRHLVTSGDLKSPEDASGRQVARILRSSPIGKGVERYAPCLDGYCEELRERLQKADEDESRERLAARLDRAVKARDWVLSILRLAPTGEVPYTSFLEGARVFLERHVAIRSPEDAAALSQLRERLAGDPRFDGRSISVAEATDRLIRIAESVAVEVSGPRPGHVHVCGIRNGGLSGRTRTFVLGLDDLRFPGPTYQDPILSDPERERLGPVLLRTAARAADQVYALAECLARLRGHITLSYPAFDLSDNRRRFPSSVLLQAHRLRTGDSNADYAALLQAIGQPMGFVSGALAVSPDAWWLSQIHQGGRLRDARTSVLGAFHDLARGAVAEEVRTRSQATPHDGKIALDPARDPRENRNLIVSASRMESYAGCPRSYFLQYVLEVEAPEELAMESGIWLDAMQRGSLLHEFYHRFLSELAGKKERPDPRTHLRRAEEVLAAVIAEYKDVVPPPSEAVFTLEAEELRRSIKVFLQGEVDHRSKNTPTYFEVSFGLEDAEGNSLRDPVEIALPGGAIRCRGKIDRMDRRPVAHEWEVWDYKTGSSWGYRARDYTAGGRQLQHAIYALAATAILQGVDPQAKVVASGYLFPTEKGRGEVFRRDPSRLPEALLVMDAILDLIRDGVFLPREEKCRFCDYVPLCGSGVRARRIVLEEAGDPSTIRLKEVLDHV